MKKQRWEKLGHIFVPDGSVDWMKSHSTCPFVVKKNKNEFRIYFSSRDKQNRSHGAWIDIDLNDPKKILNISKKPFLSPGKLGCFDDSGAVPFQIFSFKKKKFCLYSGWSLGISVPFYFYVGLCEFDNQLQKCKRITDAPLLERDGTDPYLTGAPFVIIENNLWKMWYVSGIKWSFENGQPKHYYTIRYAESQNGLKWKKNKEPVIPFKSKLEYAIARPCVIKNNRSYCMWYSFRATKHGDSYRIGYAESVDGKKWNRMDDVVDLDVSNTGWDSEMLCYPYIFDHKNRRYMVYNGNGYGKTGFGLAILNE